MTKPPKVEFDSIRPLQDYYVDGGDLFNIAMLLDLAKDLPVFEVPLAGLDLVHEAWNGHSLFESAFHVRKIMKADLDAPILLDWNGRIADGRHRIVKALALGKRTIKARRMTWKPEPCGKEQKD